MKGLFHTIYRGEHNPTFVIESHRHTCYEIVYYLSGSGTVYINDKPHNFEKNTFCITSPQVRHYETYDEDTSLYFVLFHVHDYDLRLTDGMYRDSDNRVIQRHFNLMVEEMQTRPNNYQLKLDVLLLDMLIEIGRLNTQVKKINLDTNYIKRFIDENFNMKIDVGALAAMSGYSYDRFRHLFKEQFHTSVSVYLLQVRMQHAKRMLLETDRQVSDIANRCGFASSSQFIQLFREMEKITPLKYRNNALKQPAGHEFGIGGVV